MELESYSLQAINLFKPPVKPISQLLSILEDILRLSAITSDISFNFALKVANGVAHRLARFGLSILSVCCWYVVPLDIILDVLLDDHL